MYYPNKKFAQECEDFCNKYRSCNTELIGHAVELEDIKSKTCDIDCKGEHEKECC